MREFEFFSDSCLSAFNSIVKQNFRVSRKVIKISVLRRRIIHDTDCLGELGVVVKSVQQESKSMSLVLI